MKKINNTILASLVCLPIFSSASYSQALDITGLQLASEIRVKPESITPEQIENVQARQTYTYVRCWYRPHHNHDDPATSWKWALDTDGDYFKLDGYWYSSVSFKNMFYTEVSQQTIRQRCENTLNLSHEAADITFFAADNRLSYNHSIWTNDTTAQGNAINKIIVFGDSLSDNGNLFNASQWRFPNPYSWFLGHFSNGLVWTEYLAKEKQVPMYNWAVGGAAGTDQYLVLTGVNEQVESYLTYMKMAKNYRPHNTLFTLEFGLNDFVNYDRSVEKVQSDFSRAVERLYQAGAKHLVLMNLPDASKAPQFKYSAPEKATEVKQKIQAFNQFISVKTQEYKNKGMNVALFDAHSVFEDIIANPELHGFKNATDSCMDINRSSSIDYLKSHALRDECQRLGSDAYVFWGVTHPTTATHKYFADIVSSNVLKGNYVFK